MVFVKEDLRRKLLKLRIKECRENKGEWDSLIVENIKDTPEFQSAHTVLAYHPLDTEPDIKPLFDTCFSYGKKLVLPKVCGDRLKLYAVEDLSTLQKGPLGVFEPAEGEEVEPASLSISLVPAVAFDVEGYRLGFGKGFYDRLLERVSGKKIGVAYSFQVLNEIPRDPWDVPVDFIVTEGGIIRR